MVARPCTRFNLGRPKPCYFVRAYVSPIVHRQPALHGDGSRVAGAPVQRRRTHSVVLPVDRETGRPRGFAFVDYADRAVAEEAIRKFDQAPFKGRGLAVSEARPREERGPGGPPRPGGFSPRPRAVRRLQPAAPRRRPERLRAAARRIQRRGRAASAAATPRAAARTSVPTRRPSTSASRRARNATSRRARSSSGRSPASTTRTRIGARSTRRDDELDIDNIATHKDSTTDADEPSRRSAPESDDAPIDVEIGESGNRGIRLGFRK